MNTFKILFPNKYWEDFKQTEEITLDWQILSEFEIDENLPRLNSLIDRLLILCESSDQNLIIKEQLSNPITENYF